MKLLLILKVLLLFEQFDVVSRMFLFINDWVYPPWVSIRGPKNLSLISWFKLFYLNSFWLSGESNRWLLGLISSSVLFSSIFRNLSLSTKLSLKEHLLVATMTVDVGFNYMSIYLSIPKIYSSDFLKLSDLATGDS